MKAPDGPSRVCDNKTSTSFPANVGSKFSQHYQFRSPEWEAVYNHGRNSVESFNGYLKDGGTHALEDGSRRRMRGSAAQYFLATVAVVAANLDKLTEFAAQSLENQVAPAPEGKRRARRATSVQRLNHARGRARRPEPARRT